MVEDDDRRTRLVEHLPSVIGSDAGPRAPSLRVVVPIAHQYSRPISSLVTKKSTASTATDAGDDGVGRARPTPCVPPVVRKPT